MRLSTKDDIRPALRYPGAKLMVGQFITPIIPPHATWIDLCRGSNAMTIRKSRSAREIGNDASERLGIFDRTLQNPRERRSVVSCLRGITPTNLRFNAFAKRLNEDAIKDPVELCVAAVFVAHFARMPVDPFCGDLDAYYTPDQAMLNGWPKKPEQVDAFGRAMEGVEIWTADMFEVLDKFAGDGTTCIYIDPPYPRDVAPSKLYGRQLTLADHQRLLTLLQPARAKIIISGYSHPMYEAMLAGWERRTVPSHRSSRKVDAPSEVFWRNY